MSLDQALMQQTRDDRAAAEIDHRNRMQRIAETTADHDLAEIQGLFKGNPRATQLDKMPVADLVAKLRRSYPHVSERTIDSVIAAVMTADDMALEGALENAQRENIRVIEQRASAAHFAELNRQTTERESRVKTLMRGRTMEAALLDVIELAEQLREQLAQMKNGE